MQPALPIVPVDGRLVGRSIVLSPLVGPLEFGSLEHLKFISDLALLASSTDSKGAAALGRHTTMLQSLIATDRRNQSNTDCCATFSINELQACRSPRAVGMLRSLAAWPARPLRERRRKWSSGSGLEAHRSLNSYCSR